VSDRIHLATRKGWFLVERGQSGAWSVARTAFLGHPVTIALHDPRDGTTYAALNLGHFGVKLHRSADDGATWDEIAVPTYPPSVPDGLDATPSAPSLVQIWALEPGAATQRGRLWAGTIPGGLFRSDDGGRSWSLVESLWQAPQRRDWFGGGYDDPGIHSICIDPRDPAHMSVAVSCGGVWTSADAGATWELGTRGMYAEYMPPERREDPTIQDPHRMVQCPAAPDVMWVQHHNGAFRSADGGASWSEIAVQPSKFGFAVAAHPRDPNTAWFVPGVKDECRIPVDGRVVVARTRDGGRSFDVLDRGLPQGHAYDLVYRHGLDVDGAGERLAMGSTTGSLWIGEGGGDRWTCVSTHLPPIYQVRFVVGGSARS